MTRYLPQNLMLVSRRVRRFPQIWLRIFRRINLPIKNLRFSASSAGDSGRLSTESPHSSTDLKKRCAAARILPKTTAMDFSNPFFSPDFHFSEHAPLCAEEIGFQHYGKLHTPDCGFGSSGAGWTSVSVPPTDVGHLRRPNQFFEELFTTKEISANLRDLREITP